MLAPCYARKDFPVLPGTCEYVEQNEFSYQELCCGQLQDYIFIVLHGGGQPTDYLPAAPHGCDRLKYFLAALPHGGEHRKDNIPALPTVGQSKNIIFRQPATVADTGKIIYQPCPTVGDAPKINCQLCPMVADHSRIIFLLFPRWSTPQSLFFCSPPPGCPDGMFSSASPHHGRCRSQISGGAAYPCMDPLERRRVVRRSFPCEER